MQLLNMECALNSLFLKITICHIQPLVTQPMVPIKAITFIGCILSKNKVVLMYLCAINYSKAFGHVIFWEH